MVESEKGLGLIPPQNLPEQRKEEGAGKSEARALPSVRGRRLRRSVENSNEAIGALNWMAGLTEAEDPTNISPMQMQSMLRVDGLVHSQKPSGCIGEPEAALRSLLRGGTPYDLGLPVKHWPPTALSGSAFLRRFSLALISGQYFRETTAVFGGGINADVAPEGKLLAERLPEPYWDPVLKWNTMEYHKLVGRLHGIGYFTYIYVGSCF